MAQASVDRRMNVSAFSMTLGQFELIERQRMKLIVFQGTKVPGLCGILFV